ncbi:MAG: adenosylcobinamide-phosphate synthase CbiB [Pseudomonadota bacterium]
MVFDASIALAVLGALLLDAIVGDPDWLWRRVPHPVVAFGRAIAALDHAWNREIASSAQRKLAGCLALVLLVSGAAACGWLVQAAAFAMGGSAGGLAIIALVGAVLLAQQSLYVHVARVREGFETGGLDAARAAVAMIVGRDPATLNAPAVARASIETTAENFADGVVAPTFWFLVFGLPGLFAYKMINTADSMIGYRTPRHLAFGWAAARTDDIVNVVPARMSGFLIAVAPLLRRADARTTAHAARVMMRDAAKHNSPNAGWPEAAMAGALSVALAGPRVYQGATVDTAYLNADGRRDASAADITAALRIYVAACGAHIVLVAGIAALVIVS